MALPPAYTRTYSFTDFETLNPGEPKPGDKLDTEYDAVSNALTATQTNLALIQRDDGALANDSVGEDQLQDGLFDGIGDAAAADAEAAAAAAEASATAAASSAASASTSAASALLSDANSAGNAAAAAVSQGIAQTAATDAGTAADDASDAADAAEVAANSTNNSVAEAQLHEELAFKWAEYLAAPVAPAPPGWPEAVDDGMFSSKWWALRSRDYNSVHHIDLGTSGADIGEAFDTWDLTNDLPLGLIYATWGTPPLEYALTDPSDPSDPASWTQISGGPGPPGPANTLTIGTVTSGIPAAATITGTAPNQVLSLTIPPGATGATGAAGPAGAAGAAGPPNTLTIGTVTTGAPGSAAAANITGAAPSQVLSLTIPRGDVGPAGPTNYADPTGTIGLAVVNGVATTTMRSDAAPPLSQAIAPTWSGAHTFNGAVDLAGLLKASGSEGISGQVLASQGPGLAAVWRTASGGSIELLWNFSVSVGTANPGSQKMSLNSAVYTAVTVAVFNALAQTNFDANTILSLLRPGNRIYIQQRNDASKAVVYEVTAPGTNGGGYWTIPVIHINSLSTTMFLANVDLNVVFILSSSSASGANPTANVGLTVVNGSATTFMRSDAAPPLSQAIAPTWTNPHTFSSTVSALGGPINLVSSQPGIFISESDEAANGKVWIDYLSGGTRQFSIWNDAGSASKSWQTVARSGNAITALTFGNATDNPTYNFLGTGTVTHGGPGLFPDGTTNNPSIAFTTDQDTGWYHPIAGQIRTIIDGALHSVFSAASLQVQVPIWGPNGTAAAPGIAFANEATVGLFRAASGIMGVAGALIKGALGHFNYFADAAMVSGAVNIVTTAPSSGGAVGDQWLVV